MNKKVLFTSLMVLMGSQAFGLSFKGSVSFTQSEKAQHVASMTELGHYTKTCMFNAINKHRSWMKDYGISAFYGDQSKFGKIYYMRDRKKKLQSMRKNPELAPLMKPTSCVGFVLTCLGEGFEKSGQADLWDRVKKFTKANNQTGDALIHGLQQLGWNVSYWNPKPSKNNSWDQSEKFGSLFAGRTYKGQHAAMYNSVMRRGVYYRNKVDDKTSLVNFDKTAPKKVTDAPFFVGMSHIGYHVFAGGTVNYSNGKAAKGILFESHSSRKITDKKTIEMNEFNPLKIKWKYKSGLMAFPPTK
jgi:hypothetical protein